MSVARATSNRRREPLCSRRGPHRSLARSVAAREHGPRTSSIRPLGVEPGMTTATSHRAHSGHIRTAASGPHDTRARSHKAAVRASSPTGLVCSGSAPHPSIDAAREERFGSASTVSGRHAGVRTCPVSTRSRVAATSPSARHARRPSWSSPHRGAATNSARASPPRRESHRGGRRRVAAPQQAAGLLLVRSSPRRDHGQPRTGDHRPPMITNMPRCSPAGRSCGGRRSRNQAARPRRRPADHPVFPAAALVFRGSRHGRDAHPADGELRARTRHRTPSATTSTSTGGRASRTEERLP